MEPSMKYRGGEAFKGLFSYLGAVRMKKGCRIVTNTNEGGDWLKVLYSSTYGEIYVLKEEIHSTIKDSASFIDYDGEWPRSWKGEKYVNFKLAYEGEFYFMMKHTEFTDKAKEYVQLSEGFEVYYGGFKYDKRHTKLNLIDQVQVKNGGAIVQKLSGTWNDNKKHGQFQNLMPQKQGKQSKRPKIKILIDVPVFYFNDVEVSLDRKPKKRCQANRQYIDQYDVGVTIEGVKSLDQGSCLFSEIVDLFFKHLNFSFEKYDKKIKNMKAYTVFIFEKLVPSGKVSEQRKNKVSINYEALKAMNKVYKLTSSVFEVNPLILFPLNRDKSHFALGAISSKITRKDDKITQVKFDLFYLDSLHNTEDAVPQILRQSIKQQIQENIQDPQEKQIYLKAAQEAKANFKNSLFSRQQNQVDCGVFTCVYAFLLTVDFCLSQYQVNWKWDDKQKKDSNGANLINWMRQMIKQDAYVGIHDYFTFLLQEFTSKGIIIPRRYKDQQKRLL